MQVFKNKGKANKAKEEADIDESAVLFDCHNVFALQISKEIVS